MVCKVTSTFSQAFFGRSLSCTGYPDEPQNAIRPRTRVSWYFWIRKFFFEDSKISTPARIPIKIEFLRPHVSDQHPTTYPTIRHHSLSVPGLLWEYSIKRANSASILWENQPRNQRKMPRTRLTRLSHRIKKISRFSFHMIPDSLRNQKFPLWRAGFKTFWIRMQDSPDTCRRKPYLERKSCGFKSTRIRVD